MKGEKAPIKSANGTEKRSHAFTFYHSPFTGSQGFTLLEVMISLAIIGGLLVTVLYTLNYHLGLADRHVVVTASVGLAKAKLAEMEKTPATTKGSFPEPYGTFSYETSVKDSALVPGVSEIKVVVRSGKEETSFSELVLKSGKAQ